MPIMNSQLKPLQRLSLTRRPLRICDGSFIHYKYGASIKIWLESVLMIRMQIQRTLLKILKQLTYDLCIPAALKFDTNTCIKLTHIHTALECAVAVNTHRPSLITFHGDDDQSISLRGPHRRHTTHFGPPHDDNRLTVDRRA